MQRLFWLLHLGAVLLGAATVLIGGYFWLADWTAGDRAYLHFRELHRSGASQRDTFWAFASVQAHRMNYWGELTGMLLGALIAAVGAVGFELNRKNAR